MVGFADGTVVHWFACGIPELFINQMRSAAICKCTVVHFFYKNTPEKLGHVLKIVFFPIAKKLKDYLHWLWQVEKNNCRINWSIHEPWTNII